MDQVFSEENKTLKKYWKIRKNTGKVREKSGNFVSPEKWEPCKHIPLSSLIKVSYQCLYNITMSPAYNVGNKRNQELAVVQPEWTTQGWTNGNQRSIVTNQSQSS